MISDEVHHKLCLYQIIATLLKMKLLLEFLKGHFILFALKISWQRTSYVITSFLCVIRWLLSFGNDDQNLSPVIDNKTNLISFSETFSCSSISCSKKFEGKAAVLIWRSYVVISHSWKHLQRPDTSPAVKLTEIELHTLWITLICKILTAMLKRKRLSHLIGNSSIEVGIALFNTNVSVHRGADGGGPLNLRLFISPV